MFKKKKNSARTGSDSEASTVAAGGSSTEAETAVIQALKAEKPKYDALGLAWDGYGMEMGREVFFLGLSRVFQGFLWIFWVLL